ncbi:MAG: DUF5011 domain-containing protein, partial [Actinomycetia bacterium]|nr:DUF5011 domain-containing protein [Actinomycetes bacterium]
PRTSPRLVTGLLGVSLFAFALAPMPSTATDFVWDGQFNGLWDTEFPFGPGSTLTNWNPDGPIPNPIPDSDDTATFNLATPYTTIDLNGSRTVGALSFGGTTGYTLGPAGDKLTLGSGDLTTTGSATHTINCKIGLGGTGDWSIGSNLEVHAEISGAHGLNKTGNGSLTLSEINLYTGVTNVSAGTLIVTNSSYTATGTGDLNVHSGATISGSGRAGGDWTIASGAKVTPGGSSIGTLRAREAVDLNGTYECQIDGTQRDRLLVTGHLDLGGGTLDLSTSNLTEDLYVVATYDSVTGSPTVNNLPAGFTFHTSLPSGFASANGVSSKSVALVRDTTPPVITLQGADPTEVFAYYETYTEEGATANDNFDGNVTVTIGGDTVDPSTLGTYLVTYDATDSHGNAAVQVTRTVVVIPPAFNEALGTDAGNALTTGTWNVMLGDDAAFNLSSSSKNVLIGNYTGFLINRSSGSDADRNVLVGFRAAGGYTQAEWDAFQADPT